MSKLAREFISRGTAAAVAFALLYGGWRCVVVADRLGRDAQHHVSVRGQKYRNTPEGGAVGTGLTCLGFTGGILILSGLGAAAIAVLPLAGIEQVYGYVFDVPVTKGKEPSDRL